MVTCGAEYGGAVTNGAVTSGAEYGGAVTDGAIMSGTVSSDAATLSVIWRYDLRMQATFLYPVYLCTSRNGNWSGVVHDRSLGEA